MKSQEKRLCPLCERHQRMETTSGMLFWVEWGEDGNHPARWRRAECAVH